MCPIGGGLYIICNSFKPVKPFIIDDAFLDVLVRGEIRRCSLESFGQNSRLYDLTPEQARDIIKSLKPVRHKSAGTLLSCMIEIDYRLSFPGGRNIAVFDISVKSDDLIFSFNGHVYSGGASESLKNLIDLFCPAPSKTDSVGNTLLPTFVGFLGIREQK